MKKPYEGLAMLSALILGLVIVAGIFLFQAWVLMLVINLVCLVFGVGTISFKAAMAISLLLSIVGGYFRMRK